MPGFINKPGQTSLKNSLKTGVSYPATRRTRMHINQVTNRYKTGIRPRCRVAPVCAGSSFNTRPRY
ncbi:hypothetical protein SAMN04487894_102200 [Niabella drilacis]|uniref:Uncharacterized protein n=1 Tax=Niabella drilacis (strain DSM 25811 / CCM 8410 / CCUG 62505 / LMG 26954 / E90) TaxID=1285928 RepID=A0A1G6L2S7_NIADE|nr:hypothetical protein SAMN04487894_102200 [Niabella drilacis]